MLSFFLAWIVRAWVATFRLVIEEPPCLDGARVLAFFHGQQMALLPARRRGPLTVLVSLSKDGALQSQVLGRLGLRVVRGSSSRRASTGLLGLVRALRDGSPVAVAVDGPRGPVGVAKPGAAFAAQAAGVPLHPVATAARRKIVLGRAWDRFEIPLPFARVALVVGDAISPETVACEPRVVSMGIERARARAEALITNERAA